MAVEIYLAKDLRDNLDGRRGFRPLDIICGLYILATRKELDELPKITQPAKTRGSDYFIPFEDKDDEEDFVDRINRENGFCAKIVSD